MIQEFLIRLTLNGQLRRKLWKRIAAQLKYNVSLLEIFKNLREQYEHSGILHGIFSDIYTNYEEAESLSKCLGKYIPYDEMLLIESCESNGKLQEGFLLAERIITAKENIANSVKSALFYPAFLFVLLIIMLLVVAFMLVPSFAEVGDPGQWQGFAKILYYVSMFIGSVYGAVFGIFFIIGLIAMFYSFPNYTGQYRAFLDRYMPYSIYRMVVGATWLFTFSSLMKAGKQQNEILIGMANSEINTPYLRSRVQAILDEFVGNRFGDALVLAKTGFPDEELIRDLTVYANLPEFEQKLYEISEDWIVFGEQKLKEQAKVVQNVFLVLITCNIIGIGLAYTQIIQTF